MTSADGEMRAENLGELLDQVSKNSTGVALVVVFWDARYMITRAAALL